MVNEIIDDIKNKDCYFENDSLDLCYTYKDFSITFYCDIPNGVIKLKAYNIDTEDDVIFSDKHIESLFVYFENELSKYYSNYQDEINQRDYEIELWLNR